MSTAKLSSRRVLVMEDDGLLAMHITDTLDELGHVVIGPFRSVENAMAVIEKETIDVALLDVNLGNGETSYPVAESLRGRGVPFAFLTGYGENGLIKAFQGCPVISKPINEAHLVRTLRELIRS